MGNAHYRLKSSVQSLTNIERFDSSVYALCKIARRECTIFNGCKKDFELPGRHSSKMQIASRFTSESKEEVSKGS